MLFRVLQFCLTLALVSTAFAADNDPVVLQARLQTHLTSYLSKPGTPFRCVVIAPYAINGEVLIPQGSTLYGVVRKAKAVRLGLYRERASLDLTFERYETPDGESFHFSGQLVAIDNSREEVTPQGSIRGIIAANNPNQLINGIWKTPNAGVFLHSISGMTGLSAEILEKYEFSPIGPAIRIGLRCALLQFPEPEIHLPPGTDLQILVDQSRTMFTPQMPEARTDAPGDLRTWLSAQPSTVEDKKGRTASDVINVMFVGSQQELVNSFTVSGWFLADDRTSRTITRSFLAFNRMTAYSAAPFSPLTYRGRLPDLGFEKSFDTVSKRHHIRIWRVGTYQDRDVWLGAATHDTGLRFNRFTFLPTHSIDYRVDGERSKVVVDLQFAGCSEPVMYSTRDLPSAPRVQTDGRVAVLELQSCSARPDGDLEPAPRLPGNRASRLVRRVVLEARSYVMRENMYYWSFQLARHYWVTRHDP